MQGKPALARRMLAASALVILLFAAPRVCRAQTQVGTPLPVPDDVLADKLVYLVPVVYPQIALMAHVSGMVLIHIVVAKDGTGRDVTFVSGPVLLRLAAMNAVRVWRFEPTLLNGQPVEVQGTVGVGFRFDDEPKHTFKASLHSPGLARGSLNESIEIVGPGNTRLWGPFISAFEDASTRAWLGAFPSSASDKKGKVTVVFLLRRDGSTSSVSIGTSSGDPAIDVASQLAITKSAPFPPMPGDLPYPATQFRVTFAFDHPQPSPSAGGAQ